LHRISQALAVACGVARPRRTETADLAKRKIAAKYRHTFLCEFRGQRLQQAGLRIAAGAMRNNKDVTRRRLWAVEKAAHRRIKRSLGERLERTHAHII
jgi:hypothetical protein